MSTERNVRKAQTMMQLTGSAIAEYLIAEHGDKSAEDFERMTKIAVKSFEDDLRSALYMLQNFPVSER